MSDPVREALIEIIRICTDEENSVAAWLAVVEQAEPALAALAAAPDPLEEAREVVAGLNPWTGYDASGARRTMWILTEKDCLALRRALGMKE